MTHVDDWIDSSESDDYAAWVLNHFRRPAILKARFQPFMEAHRLFCTFEGRRCRVTGASRLGDIYLTYKLNIGVGYDERVAVDECSAWGPTP